ncbi:hypothetical protein BN1007_140062 [Klebsiella variicola]|nr:hypothetical protein BN1007_140062 [Klebsiella variicola]
MPGYICGKVQPRVQMRTPQGGWADPIHASTVPDFHADGLVRYGMPRTFALGRGLRAIRR